MLYKIKITEKSNKYDLYFRLKHQIYKGSPTVGHCIYDINNNSLFINYIMTNKDYEKHKLEFEHFIIENIINYSKSKKIKFIFYQINNEFNKFNFIKIDNTNIDIYKNSLQNEDIDINNIINNYYVLEL